MPTDLYVCLNIGDIALIAPNSHVALSSKDIREVETDSSIFVYCKISLKKRLIE